LNLILGEAFWDQFPDNSVLLGGSALNVAWNLEGLGGESHFVTRVGDDDLGRRVIHEMKQWGMDTHGVQIDDQGRDTGVIKVLMDENKQATYISPGDISFDHIEYSQSLDVISPDYLMYHCTYILRSQDSQSTIKKLKEKGHPVFMDLNLRDPYWSEEVLENWVKDLEILKLSNDEFPQLSKIKENEAQKQINWLQGWMTRRNIKNILFTLGDLGAYWITSNQTYFAQAEKIQAVSTVGAGDAFCAGVMFSRELGLSPKDSIEKSSKFAAKICSVTGATSHDKEFYENCRKQIWGL